MSRCSHPEQSGPDHEQSFGKDRPGHRRLARHRPRLRLGFGKGRRAGAGPLRQQREKEADAVVAEIRKAGGRAEKVGADLRQADGPHILAKRVRAVVGDRLDILVANAGISKAASIEDTEVEDFDNLFAVNVRAPFFLVQQLLPVLCKGSNIILTSSAAAHAAVGALSTLCRDQGRSRHAGEALRLGPGSRGIRVNAIAPGVVETDMSIFTKTQAGREVTLGMQALKRLAQPDDIAPVMAFLASDDARWITGDIVHVDGGSKL